MIEVFTSCVAVIASQTHLMPHFTFPQICQKFCQFLHKLPGRIDTIHIKQVSNCLVIQMAQSNWTCLSERQMAPNSLTKDTQLTRSRRTPRTTVADNPHIIRSLQGSQRHLVVIQATIAGLVIAASRQAIYRLVAQTYSTIS